ncbi:MAG: DUF4105 domain-containing protein [Candidatus Thalassarchaeaceae archaeon]|jgi:hypothetical protein|nr:DUF4105 domain-containing protein [Candidatus Thalassarchaeaceae archaeon]
MKVQYIAFLGFAILALIINFWWLSIGRKKARNDRNWVPDCAQTAHFTVHEDGDTFTLHNRRDFTWRTTKDYDEKWDEWSAKISDIVGVYYVIDHFHKIRGMAHTMIGFEFEKNQFLMASFECRREIGERYHPWTGLWNEFELMIVWATERDILGVRTNARKNDVFLFPCQATPEKRKELFKGMVLRTNEIQEKPEWYNTLTSTCTTSIVRVVNKVTPGRVPFTWRALFPGYSAWTVWKRNIIVKNGTFEETISAAAITEKANQTGLGLPGSNEYSMKIRE